VILHLETTSQYSLEGRSTQFGENKEKQQCFLGTTSTSQKFEKSCSTPENQCHSLSIRVCSRATWHTRVCSLFHGILASEDKFFARLAVGSDYFDS
jgi:hypothetical protein